MKKVTEDVENRAEKENSKNGDSSVLRSTQNNSPAKMEAGPKALDGGWGWVVILSTVLAHIIYGVMVRSFGVIYLEMLARFKGTPSATGWIGAINIAACGILGPLTTFLCVKYSHRTVTIVGGIIMAVGVLITAYSPNLIVLYISYGLISGTGLSMTYTPGFLILGQYFDKRRGLAMGIANFGSGIGTLFFPPQLIVLFEKYGYTGALIILAGICLQCCVSGALFRPLNQNRLAKPLPPVLEAEGTEMLDMKNTKSEFDEELEKMVERKRLESEDHDQVSGTEDIEAELDEDSAAVMKEYDALINEKGRGLRENEDSNSNDLVSSTNGHANTNLEDKFRENYTLPDDVTELTVLNETTSSKPSNGATTSNKDTHKSMQLCCCLGIKPKSQKAVAPNGQKKPPLFDIELIKDKNFVATCIVIFSAAQALALTSGFLPALAVEHGSSPTAAAFLLSISDMSSSIGGLVLGAMMDIKKIKPYRVNLFSIYSFMMGLNTILNPLARQYWEFVILCIFRAGFAGVMVAQRATIVADLVGPRKVPNAFGWLLFFFSLGSLFGRSIGGTLKDALGSYGAPFYISGGMSLLCCAIFTIVTMPPTGWGWLFNRGAPNGKSKNNEFK